MGSTFIPFNVEPSERFHRLHRLAAEIYVTAETANDAEHAGAEHNQRMEDLHFQVERVAREIEDRPVQTFADLLDRAAMVLYWSEGGLQPSAWADPVEHLTDFVPNRTCDPVATGGASLAAAIFQLAGFRGPTEMPNHG